MQHRIFVIYFIISLFVVFLNGNNSNGNFELFRARKSSSVHCPLQQEVLEAHNKYRDRHEVPHLSLDNDLNLSAQKYAEHLARTNTFDHSESDDVGENLYMMTTTSRKPYELTDLAHKAVDGWYNEIKDYNFKKATFAEETGHFTQMVWKETTKLGVGCAAGKRKSTNTFYIVTHYLVPGNVDGDFSENVLPPKD